MLLLLLVLLLLNCVEEEDGNGMKIIVRKRFVESF